MGNIAVEIYLQYVLFTQFAYKYYFPYLLKLAMCSGALIGFW